MADSKAAHAIFVLLAASICTAWATKQSPQRVQFQPPDGTRSCSSVARFDMSGLRGIITFFQRRASAPVQIDVDMMGLDQFPNSTFGWHVHEFPVNFGLLRDMPCSEEEVGGHYDPLDRSSSPTYTRDCANIKRFCEVGDLAGKFGALRADQSRYTFEDPNMNLYSSFSPVGRSIVIHQQNGSRFACANLEYQGNPRVETYRAPFPHPPFEGDIILKRQAGKAGVTLYVELYRTDGGPVTNISFGWSLRRGKPGANGCGDLGPVYGSRTHGHNLAGIISRCSIRRQRLCFIGNLTGKCGRLQIDSRLRRIKHFCTDIQLGYVPPRNYLDRSIAIEGPNGTILACSCFSRVRPEAAVGNIDMGYGIKRIFGQAFFYQTDPFEQTYVRVFVMGLNGQAGYFQIRQLPVTQPGNCTGLGAVFEPRPDFMFTTPLPPVVTGDRVHLGSLKYKWTNITGAFVYRRVERSSYLPLFGPFNITGHALVLHRANGLVWACTNILRYYSLPVPNTPSILGFDV